MEIGPVSAIRPVTMLKRSPSAPDLSRVFEVEYLGQSNDDGYTPADRKPGRGLEDEDGGEELSCASGGAPEAGHSGHRLSLFA